MSTSAGSLNPVQECHLRDLLSNVRDEDRLEFECVQGRSVEDELRYALEQSVRSSAYVIGGEVVAIFGEGVMNAQTAVPWMISTYAVDRHRRSFLRQCDIQVHGMRQRYGVLVNYTDARYQKALKWMEWLGFHKHDAIPYGINGELFHPFTLRGIPWVQQQPVRQS